MRAGRSEGGSLKSPREDEKKRRRWMEFDHGVDRTCAPGSVHSFMEQRRIEDWIQFMR